jgi:osmotically-inducible protein OsmY
MKTTIFGLVCGIALAAGPVSAAAALPQAPIVKASDHTLTERIETRFRQDAALKKHDVKVTVDGGVAMLTGIVASAAEKTRAAQLARVNGIVRVDNQLVVDRSAADAVVRGTKGTVEETKDVARAAGATAKEAGEKAKDGAVKVGEKTKEGAETIGEKTKDGAVTAAEKTKDGAVTVAEKTKDGAVTVAEKTKDGAATVAEKTRDGFGKVAGEISDALILTSVKSKFVGEDVLKGSDINVDCDQHVVRLRGTVPTAAARDRAVQLARGTDGVQRVIDDLTIGLKK